MVLALSAAALSIRLMLWAMFHPAGGPVHLLLALGLLTLVWRVIRGSDLRAD